MRKPLILFALFLSSSFYSQKSRLLNPSGFRHNYVVGHLQYIEDKSDTTRLKYIAGLEMSFGSNHEELGLLDFLQIKAKELGADCYYLVSHLETASNREVVVKLFFGGEKFLKNNEAKRHSLYFAVFNQNRRAGDSAFFYLNGKQQSFDAQHHYLQKMAVKESCSIAVNENPVTATEVMFKKAGKARFFILPENKKSVVVGQARPTKLLVVVNGIALNIHTNSLYEISYELGRLWLEMY